MAHRLSGRVNYSTRQHIQKSTIALESLHYSTMTLSLVSMARSLLLLLVGKGGNMMKLHYIWFILVIGLGGFGLHCGSASPVAETVVLLAGSVDTTQNETVLHFGSEEASEASATLGFSMNGLVAGSGQGSRAGSIFLVQPDGAWVEAPDGYDDGRLHVSATADFDKILFLTESDDPLHVRGGVGLASADIANILALYGLDAAQAYLPLLDLETQRDLYAAVDAAGLALDTDDASLDASSFADMVSAQGGDGAGDLVALLLQFAAAEADDGSSAQESVPGISREIPEALGSTSLFYRSFFTSYFTRYSYVATGGGDNGGPGTGYVATGGGDNGGPGPGYVATGGGDNGGPGPGLVLRGGTYFSSSPELEAGLEVSCLGTYLLIE